MFGVESEALGIDNVRPSPMSMYAQMLDLASGEKLWPWSTCKMVELMKAMWNHGDRWVVIEDMVWEEGVYKYTLMQGQMGEDGGWIQKRFVLWEGHTI